MTEAVRGFAARLDEWYRKFARPFFVEFGESRVPQFDEDFSRLTKLLEADHPELHVCFLGQAGVGKSTLINALVDENTGVLPQGGVGPLTAQATQVRYSADPYFRVSYLGAKTLNQLLFALWSSHEAAARRESTGTLKELASLIPEEISGDVEHALPVDAADAPRSRDERAADSSKIDGYFRQAKLLIRGDQHADVETEYLLYALRLALGMEPGPPQPLLHGDEERIERIRTALETAGSDANTVEYRWSEGRRTFLKELARHAAGHIAPLIRTLDVGWDSAILKNGLVLVDLPGVGVANDEYRNVTAEFIRRAKAVVLVVDRAGVTEASAELLQSVGFLTSLLHEEIDSEEVPQLSVAVVKLDLTADDWRRDEFEEEGTRRPWVEYFREACERSKQLVRAQMGSELSKIVREGASSTFEERSRVFERVLADLHVYPVSASEYHKFYTKDEDAPAKIKDPAESHIPDLGKALEELARRIIEGRRTRLRGHVESLRDRLSSSIDLIASGWAADKQAAARSAKLRAEVEEQTRPLLADVENRRSRFREFFRETVPQKISAAVAGASLEARSEVGRHLRKFRQYHWSTLRAAVRRGGTFVGAKKVDIPNDLSLIFEEQIAAIWTRDILTPIRKRTADLGADYVAIQKELLGWLRASVPDLPLGAVETLHNELASITAGFGSVGREAVDELRARVKVELFESVQESVQRACQKFVADQRDRGSGTFRRMLEMIEDELPDAVIAASRSTAERVLIRNYKAVQDEISHSLGKLPNPILVVKDQLFASKEELTRREDSALRARFEGAVGSVRSSFPNSPALV